ncbi:hypothetical protein PBY51_016939 [Eleginops maclovinus]|uniref:Uncharacterized protein n=1 Tax=Eleginops maclovinus TaxID=56733 RepID=A0AAN8A018_ELEMC|nr:hypothetical protein PBY51_016939 [Eleginops maclovinus]
MVTQITPHHTAYLDLTRNNRQTEYRTTATKTVLIDDARRFHFFISFREKSRVPLVAHVTLWYGPIGWNRLSWVERKEEGEKNHFLFAIFNLATLKRVVIYCILRYRKVTGWLTPPSHSRWPLNSSLT